MEHGEIKLHDGLKDKDGANSSTPSEIKDSVDKKHTSGGETLGGDLSGTAGNATVKVDDFTIKKDGNNLKIADRIELNTMLNFFRDAIDESRSIHNMIDGIVDEYEDETGIDTGASTNEDYDSSNDLYQPSILYTGKWNASGVFNGTTSHLDIPDHADWDIQTNFTVDLWVKHTDHAGDEAYIGQWEGGVQFWVIRHVNGTGIRFWWYGSGETKVQFDGGEITDTDWHHVAVIKVGNEHGIYLDGIQTGYIYDADTDTFAGKLYIGAEWWGTPDVYHTFFDGYLDEIRIYHGNPFSATPSTGNTDTITVPTSAHISDSNTKLLLHLDGNFTDSGNTGHTVTNFNVTFEGTPYSMTLISNSNTAEAVPDSGRIVLFEEDVDAITLNTDLKAYVSRDGGSTWAEVTLIDEGDYDNNIRILTATVDLTATGIGSGTNMEYKIETLNNKDLRIHGTGLLWD